MAERELSTAWNNGVRHHVPKRGLTLFRQKGSDPFCGSTGYFARFGKYLVLLKRFLATIAAAVVLTALTGQAQAQAAVKDWIGNTATRAGEVS